jgi:hypothetical protein
MVSVVVVPRPASRVEEYLGRVRRWLWVREFILAKRRGTRGRRIPTESSLARYAEVLERLERYTTLDLATW